MLLARGFGLPVLAEASNEWFDCNINAIHTHC
jgi:hypothetical protein